MKLSDIDIHDVGNSITIAGAVFIGNGKLFLCMLPEDRGDILATADSEVMFVPGRKNPIRADNVEEYEVHVLNMDADEWGVFIRQTDLLEVEMLARLQNGTIGKAILRKSARQVDQSVSWAVFRRDNYACRYCGKDDIPLTVDHLVCYEEGGPSTMENMVSSCKKCNKTRGNMKYADWLSHPHYVRTSRNLTEVARISNFELAKTLDSIPRVYVKSR